MAEALTPVIEVTGNNWGDLAGTCLHLLNEALDLPTTAGREEAEMHHKAMHFPFFDFDHHVQDATLLVSVVRTSRFAKL